MGVGPVPKNTSFFTGIYLLLPYSQDRSIEQVNQVGNRDRPEHGLDAQSLISARNVKPNHGHDDLHLGAQGLEISMNRNQESSPNGGIFQASTIAFAEDDGPTQEIIENARAECEGLFAARFPSVDRAKIERIVNDVILSLQSGYPRPQAPKPTISPGEDDEDSIDDARRRL